VAPAPFAVGKIHLMPVDRATIWKRRVVLMVVVALVVAVPVTLLIRGGGEDEAPTVTVDRAAAPAVDRPDEVDRKLGVAVHQLPQGWRSKRKGGVLTMRSRRRDAAVVVTSPGPVERAGEIHQQAIAAVRAQYRDVKVVEESRGELGGRKARTAALAARPPEGGGRLGIMVVTARGEKRAYLVEVFTRGENPGVALLEAQAVLNNLELRG
jgi:hypothetical protein